MGNGNNETYEYLITELYKLKKNDEDLTFREILFDLHYTDGLSYREMAKELRVSLSTIYMWAKREGILDKQMKW